MIDAVAAVADVVGVVAVGMLPGSEPLDCNVQECVQEPWTLPETYKTVEWLVVACMAQALV